MCVYIVNVYMHIYVCVHTCIHFCVRACMCGCVCVCVHTSMLYVCLNLRQFMMPNII